VVSVSKELGYIPHSARCARATIDITFNSTSATTFSLPINSPFVTNVNNVTYTFYTTSTVASSINETSHTFTGVEIVEKNNQLSNRYTVASGVQFIIPNKYADLSTLTVSVQESGSSSNVTIYTLADNIVNITPVSNVYWIKEIDDGLYELTFGNNIIGTSLTNGNIVILKYSISSLDVVNGANLFSFTGTLPAGITTQVTTTSKASGGSIPEDIESIRFNAPRAYSAQNRGVTVDDYKALIYANFSDAQSVAVWGGEDNTPPIYGKTFISIKSATNDILTTAQKDYILNTLLPNKNVLTVQPVIVDPEYIEIILNTTVYYNDLNTTKSYNDIKTLVQSTILDYNVNELQKFEGIFRFSKLSKLIDETEESIVSNITTVGLKRAVNPKYNVYAEYTIHLINPIYYSGAPEDIVLSSGFFVSDNAYVHYITDDGVGNIQLFYLNENNFRVTVNKNLGTVDYFNGIISFKNLRITSIVGSTFYLYIKPSSNDVVSALTQIIQISQDDLIVNVISDKTASGDLRGGKNYTFTTSRT
jgi:hypothetical protein